MQVSTDVREVRQSVGVRCSRQGAEGAIRKGEDEPSGLIHLKVVTSHDIGAQQFCVAEQSAPKVLGPAVHTSDGAESVADGFPDADGSVGATEGWT